MAEGTLSMRQAIQLTLLAILIASCAVSSPGSSADVYLPTYGPMNGLPVAKLGGQLVLEDGCLWLEDEQGRALPLWPAGSRIESEGETLVVVNSGGARAEVGTDVVGGGGEYGVEHYKFVVELIGGEVPTRCRGYDRYWLVYDVHAAGDD